MFELPWSFVTLASAHSSINSAARRLRVCSGFPAQKSDDVACRVLGLHQRHGQAVGDVLTNAVKNHSAELVRGSVASSSVLMMTVAPGQVPALANVGRRSDPLETWLAKETRSTTVDGAGVRYSPQQGREKIVRHWSAREASSKNFIPTASPRNPLSRT